MAIFATAAPFIYNKLRQQAEARILAEDYKRYEILTKFSRTLYLLKDNLDRLVKLIVYRLVKTLRIAYSAIYLYNKETGSYTLKSSFSLKKIKPAYTNISPDTELIRFILRYKKEFLYEHIQQLMGKSPLKGTDFLIQLPIPEQLKQKSQ